MRSFIALAIIVTFVYSCAPKSGPAPLPASNSGTTNNTTTATKPVVTTSTATVNSKKESEEVMAGRTIFNDKCGRCHGLKNPADYSSNQWVSIMDKMAPKANLDMAEKANVLAYVQANARF